jgi:hypothetical protein
VCHKTRPASAKRENSKRRGPGIAAKDTQSTPNLQSNFNNLQGRKMFYLTNSDLRDFLHEFLDIKEDHKNWSNTDIDRCWK